MDMNGNQLIAAPRAKVYAALNDAAILKAAIPGCESLEQVSPTELKAVVSLRVGPVKASFTGKVTLSDLDPPNGYRITGEGSGGPAGYAKGGATVTLREQDGGTLLTYSVHAQIGGKLAQLGSRLIDATAKTLAAEFFDRFSRALGPAVAESAASAAATRGGFFARLISIFRLLFSSPPTAGRSA